VEVEPLCLPHLLPGRIQSRRYLERSHHAKAFFRAVPAVLLRGRHQVLEDILVHNICEPGRVPKFVSNASRSFPDVQVVSLKLSATIFVFVRLCLRHQSTNLFVLVQINLCLHLFNDRRSSSPSSPRHLLVPGVPSTRRLRRRLYLLCRRPIPPLHHHGIWISLLICLKNVPCLLLTVNSL
jgi:hypothetical protein